MIIVTVAVRVKPGAIEEAKAHIAAVVAATRQEPGCLSYTIGVSVSDPNEVFAFEEWESEAALDAHFAQEHTRAFFAAVTPLIDGPMNVQRRTAEEPQPL